jgi:hypothetical protein
VGLFGFKIDEEAMEGSSNNRERRSCPRFVIDMPLEYREMGDSCLRGGIVIDVSGEGLLIETVRDIPVGTELNVTILFPKGSELANFKVVTKIVRKKPYWKEDCKGNRYWEGYQYGLKFIQILEENRWKLDLLLGWTT